MVAVCVGMIFTGCSKSVKEEVMAEVMCVPPPKLDYFSVAVERVCGGGGGQAISWIGCLSYPRKRPPHSFDTMINTLHNLII